MEGIKKILTIFLMPLFLWIFLSCSAPLSSVYKEPTKGIYHKIKKGETLWSIARAYRVNLQDLAEANNITDPSRIEEGSVIFIPDADAIIDDIVVVTKDSDAKVKAAAKKTAPVLPRAAPANDVEKTETTAGAVKSADERALSLPPPESAKTADAAQARESSRDNIERKAKVKPQAEEKEEIRFEKKRFIWPVVGSVKTRFGIQPNNTYHNWIKIVSAVGSQVRAAASGTVIFSSNLKDYGETIIVRHEDGFATVYSHLKKRQVRSDQSVKKGEIIAVTGEKDEAGDPYMNFEVRLRGKARNPLFFLP